MTIDDYEAAYELWIRCQNGLNDKDEVIKRQKLEINLLKNKISQREKEIVKQNE